MKQKKVVLFAVIMLALVIAGCGAAKPAQDERSVPQEEPQIQGEKSGYDLESPAAGVVDSTTDADGRMVIRSAQMSVVVEDVEVTLPQVISLVGQMEGYVVSSNSYRTYSDRLAATVTLRVPEARFNEALEALRKLGKVQTETLSGEDVTDQYVDLQARLKVREATETELLGLLSEIREGTGTADEKAQAILNIYNQLTAVRTEIEQIRGQMQYLEQMSAMATVTLELTPRELETGEPNPGDTFTPLSTLGSAGQALLDVLKWLVNAIIWLVVVILPVAVIGLAPWALVYWVWRRRRLRRTQSAKA